MSDDNVFALRSDDTDEGPHWAHVFIAPELLANGLHLPRGTRIVNVRWEDRFGYGGIVLTVQHESLRNCPPGCAVPEVDVLITRYEAEFRYDP